MIENILTIIYLVVIAIVIYGVGHSVGWDEGYKFGKWKGDE